MQEAATNIKNFLQFLVLQFIEDKQDARLKVVTSEEESALGFRLILSDRDVAKLIGKNGFTASAVRSVIKAVGEKHDINVTLKILSQQEEEELMS